MPRTRGLPRAAALALALAVAVVGLGTPAQAGPAPQRDATVRMVVHTTGQGAHRQVAELLRDRDARRVHTIPALRAVSAEVAAAVAGRLRQALLRRAYVRSVDVAQRRFLTAEPNDTRLAEQRAYLDAVQLVAAWDRAAQGSSTVQIGMVDSGADVTHPDLAGKVAGTYNAVTGGSDVRDLVGHGTGTASVAGAATDNGVGIAGAGYDTSLLIAKVADRAGRIFTDDLARGIVWATDHGADVLNLSLGGPSSDELERAAVDYALRRGVVVVAAAGNDGTSARQFPAALPGVLSVGATTVNGSARANFSSYGPWVDVAAPGADLLVATPGGGYARADGTSFAAPLVSGIVALLRAYRPQTSAGDLAHAVTAGATSTRYGFARGLVNAAASLDLLAPSTAPALSLSSTPVSGFTTVTASSSAPKVRFQVDDLVQTVNVVSGQAAASFETYGLGGNVTVRAVDCSLLTLCADSGSTGTLTVANAAPTLTSPSDGADASADTVTASAEAPGGAVRFLVDGQTAATDTTAPFTAALSTQGLSDGTHTVSAVLCRSDGSRCDTSTSSSATVSVARLHPRLAQVGSRRLSPGRDGRGDQVALAYRLDVASDVTLRVTNASGRVVLSRSLGRQAAGPHRVTWDGRSRVGIFVPSGVYQVGVATRSPDGSRRGLASTAITVDRGKPTVRSVSRGAATLYPWRDGYRDTVRLEASVREPVVWVRTEARRNGGVYYSATRPAQGPGPVGMDWNGRTAAGRALPPGRYQVRLQVQDLAGNRARSKPVTLTLSGRRLVKRSGSMTVTARGSLKDTFADECSLVFRHSEGKRAGWLGYYSSGTCSSADAYAIGEHEVVLPRAARYGTVQISAYGGRGDPKYRDSARLVYYDKYENESRFVARLRPGVGAYTGPRVSADRLLFDRRHLRWETMATGVAWYDVRDYTVRYTYFVLR